ncbi:MAG TPA: hypothetical protein EYN67_18515 [Flavobacteriales bacterium]|nr:hypothetical protein [Flavobacteriales bacterium]
MPFRRKPGKKTTRRRQPKKTATKKIATLVKDVKALKSTVQKKFHFYEQWYYPGATSFLIDYRCHAMINPITMQPLWKQTTSTDLSTTGRKVKFTNLKMMGACSTGNEDGPINFDVFLFRIRPKFRQQFSVDIVSNDQDLNGSPSILKEGLHYVQMYGPQQNTTIPLVKDQFTMMNKEIFDIKKEMHFRIGSSTYGSGITGQAPSSLNFPPSTHNIRDTVRTFSWNIPLKTTITCDDSSWRDPSHGIHTYQVPPALQYYLIAFTDNASGDGKSPAIYVNSVITTERG